MDSKLTEIEYINLLDVLVPVGVATGSTAITAELLYRTRIAGRRQVTVRFVN